MMHSCIEREEEKRRQLWIDGTLVERKMTLGIARTSITVALRKTSKAYLDIYGSIPHHRHIEKQYENIYRIWVKYATILNLRINQPTNQPHLRRPS